MTPECAGLAIVFLAIIDREVMVMLSKQQGGVYGTKNNSKFMVRRQRKGSS